MTSEPCPRAGDDFYSCINGRIRNHIDQREMAAGRGYGWHDCPDCLRAGRPIQRVQP